MSKVLQLPEGWKLKPLKSLANISSEKHQPTGSTEYYIGLEHIHKNRGVVTEDAREEVITTVKNRFNAGDILYGKLRPYLNKVALANRKGVCSTDILVLRPTILVEPKYLYHFLLSRQFVNDASANTAGVNLPRVSTKYIENYLVPIPSPSIQRLIVAKIEELFSEIDAGVQELETALKRLKVYRQVVINWAFNGRLTEDWRKHQPLLPSAEVLLKLMSSNRKQEYEKKRKKLKPLEPITAREVKGLPMLPNGWCWVRPEDVCAPEDYAIGIGPFGSNLKVSDYVDSGVPLIFVKNITRNNFTLDLKFISQSKYDELKAHSAKPLDILITKMGDPPGDCAIYPQSYPNAVITSDCLKFRIWDSYVERRYFKYCLESDIIKSQLGLITQGVAQKKISTERFKTLCFPLASREEQIQIVEEIDSRLSEADSMELTILQSLNDAEALRQSILKQAFEGKLINEVAKEVEETVSTSRRLTGKSEQLSLF
ncbi:restriction endonuclease subunit S [Nibrella saemangeumensis]|uniref:Restriction endonuclease subunit S n=1 Tax=Nibrella saemangeumensis TaxID=1084526 RepID=A0ABP8MAA0_9BACT